MGRKDRQNRKDTDAGQQLELAQQIAKTENLKASDEITDSWCPSTYTAFKAFASSRLCAAVWSNISDCDETYNYWEPAHYLLYGKGFQTWEYAPQYALRSYAYLLLHTLPAWVYGLIQSNRILVFYFIRCLLALTCALCEAYYYRGVCKQFGAHVARLWLTFQLFAAGTFLASAAFLPSSFSMYLCLLAIGAWFTHESRLAIFATALSTFLSWPFAGLLGVPIALDLLLRRRRWKTFLMWSGISALTILVPMIAIDSHYYGRWVLAPLQIVLYNVFSNHGPDLYGTEPWTFYFINGFLNFNLVFVLALAALPLTIMSRLWSKRLTTLSIPKWLTLLPLGLWIAVFFTQPHKEERFLFPAYPLFCLAAAVSVDEVQELWVRMSKLISPRANAAKGYSSSWIAVLVIVISSLLSLSRIFAQYRGFHAPVDIFMEINRLSLEDPRFQNRSLNVCVGKEWYRFPSSFFLPDKWNLLFLESEFRGQLPKPFAPPPNGTWLIPSHMNDLNLEEPSRYAAVEDCHFLVDLESEQDTEREPRYSSMKAWQVVYSVDFLSSVRSHRFLRAFYVPGLTEYYCHYTPYQLLFNTSSLRELKKSPKAKKRH